MNDHHWMQEALKLAKFAASIEEVPVGAFIVAEDGATVLGRGWNQVEQRRDPTAHAEILAIQEAALNQDNHRLLGATLYVTLEPCCMCAGAMVHARVKRLVFATRDFKAGAAGSAYQLLCGHPLNHKVRVDEGPLQSECAFLLTDFFKARSNG